jgi:hypothetical protein
VDWKTRFQFWLYPRIVDDEVPVQLCHSIAAVELMRGQFFEKNHCWFDRLINERQLAAQMRHRVFIHTLHRTSIELLFVQVIPFGNDGANIASARGEVFQWGCTGLQKCSGLTKVLAIREELRGFSRDVFELL